MSPKLVGILNITPDSFSDGGYYIAVEQAVSKALLLLEEGASVIDIGAESTRPGAIAITAEEEWQRLGVALKEIIPLVHEKGGIVSVDSYHAETADKALELGADIINDVSGCASPDMQAVLAKSNAPVVIMHNVGVPASHHVTLPEGVNAVQEVFRWAEMWLEYLEQRGISLHRMIFDPGIGFGKTASQSVDLLRGVAQFKKLGVPLFIGHSRKSFLGGFAKFPPKDRDTETLAVSLYLAGKGVDYLRVHDIASHARALTVFEVLSQ